MREHAEDGLPAQPTSATPIDQQTAERLYRLSTSLARVERAEDILQKVVLPTVPAGAQAAVVMTVLEEAEGRPVEMEVVTAWSAKGEGPFAPGTRLTPAGLPVTDWMDQPNQPLFMPDRKVSGLDPAGQAFYEQHQVQSSVLLPLRAAERWEGLIAVYWPFAQEFTAGDAVFFEALAGQMALILQNLRRVQELQQQAAELQQTTTFLDTVVDNLPVMLFVKEAEELRFVRWNRGAEEITGLKEEGMLGKNDYDFFPPEEADHFTSNDRQVLETGRPLDIPVESIQSPDRGQRFLFTRKVPIFDRSGQARYLLGISEDITEQQRASAEREAVEERYRQAIEAAGAVAYALDYRTDTYTFIGEGIQEMTGYAAGEITPAIWRSLHQETVLGDEAAGLTLEQARQMARAGALQRWQGDYRIETRDGRERWITNAAVIQVDEETQATRSVGILLDITDRKEAEEALARQALELQALNRQLTRQGWDEFVAGERARLNFAFEMPLEERRVVTGWLNADEVAQPLAVRGEPIGQLTLSQPLEFPDDAPEIMAEVAERLSAHLENLRLTRQTEMALSDSERRARYQANVAQAVTALTERGMAAVPEVLRLLGEAVQVSSVYYCRLREEEQGPYWYIQTEWCAPGVPPMIDDPFMQRMELSFLPMWPKILAEKGLINSASPDFSPEIRQMLQMRGLKSLLIVPVPGTREIPDFLGFNDMIRERSWGEDEIAALFTAASALASTIQRDVLYNQVQDALTRTEDQAQRLAHLSAFGAALNATTQLPEVIRLLAEQAPDILTHDCLSLALVNRTREALDVYAVHPLPEEIRPVGQVSLTDSLAGEVVRSGRMVHIPDFVQTDYADTRLIRDQGICAVAAAPLVAGGTTLGAISLGREFGPDFDEQDENLLQQIASLLATSIESQRLLAQARARAERERQVRAAVDRVRRATDQDSILQVAREELGRMLGAAQTVVQLHHDGEEPADEQNGRQHKMQESARPAGQE